MYCDIQAGSHDCFTVIYVIFISIPHTVIICDMRVNKVMFRGRPFDILGGAWVIFQKKFLSLVLKKKNNLSLKRVKKNNLSLKRAKKNNLAWPEKKIKKISWLTIKEKSPFYFIFVMSCVVGFWGAVAPQTPPYIYINYIYAKHLVTFFILSSPHLIYMIVLFYLSKLKSIYLRPFSFLYNTNVFWGNILYTYKTNLRPL